MAILSSPSVTVIELLEYYSQTDKQTDREREKEGGGGKRVGGRERAIIRMWIKQMYCLC